MLIEIVKWGHANNRKDIKNPSWFKFYHKFIDDPDFYDFTHSEIVCWIYILCLASRENKQGLVTINIEHAHRVQNLDSETIHQTINKLKRLQIIKIRTLRGRYASVTNPSYRQEEKRIDKRREEEREETREEKNKIYIGNNYESKTETISFKEQVDECTQAWGTSLARFGILKDPRTDCAAIAALLQRHGFEKTKLALLGAGLEVSTENYNASKHCRITRLTKPDIFEKFVNLGAQQKPIERKAIDGDTGDISHES